MALQMAHERLQTHSHTYSRLHLFTDSQFSLGIITSGWRSRSHPELAKKLKQMVRDFPIPVIIAWVPAHCGIDSNEHADKLADRGAKASAKNGQNVDPSIAFINRDFIPRIYDG